MSNSKTMFVVEIFDRRNMFELIGFVCLEIINLITFWFLDVQICMS